MRSRELIDEFISYTRETLDEAEECLLGLERQVRNSSRVDEIMVNDLFRHFHTLKGRSGYMGVSILSVAAHEAENLIGDLRNKDGSITLSHIDLLFQACDLIRGLLERPGTFQPGTFQFEKKAKKEELSCRALTEIR